MIGYIYLPLCYSLWKGVIMSSKMESLLAHHLHLEIVTAHSSPTKYSGIFDWHLSQLKASVEDWLLFCLIHKIDEWTSDE
jgi:hypothetical protein